MGSAISSIPGETENKVQKLIRDNKVMIFSATYCSYCNVAKRTFDSLGTNYSAIELNKVQDGPELAKDLKEIVGNGYVPQIFICGRLIGGSDSLRQLLHTGQLQMLLMECCGGEISCSKIN